MMFCNNCDQFFSDSEAVTKIDMEYHDELDDGIRTEYRYVSTCPCCGSDDLEEAKECELCGEPFVGDDGICLDCQGDMSDDINALAAYFVKRRGTKDLSEIKEKVVCWVAENM